MKGIDSLKETMDQFLSEFAKIQDVEDLTTLSQYEMKLVHILQLMEVQVGMSGRDLYDTIQQRRLEISAGIKKAPIEAKVVTKKTKSKK